MTRPLTIAEQLFLLSHKNETGKNQGRMTAYAFAGAAIADLVLQERLVPDAEKAKRLNIANDSGTGNLFLDAVLAEIGRKGSGKTAEDYIHHLASKRKVQSALGEGLTEQGSVEKEEKSFLFFKWSIFPEANPEAEVRLIERLSAVMFDGITPSAEDCVIIALADKTGVLSKNFNKQKLKANKARIKDLIKGEIALSKPAIKVIDTISAVAAATAAAAASSAATSG